jgi:nitrile hydratase
VSAVRGRFGLPDAGAEGEVRREPLYAVEFAAADLWGDGDHRVSLDLWESYLEPGGAADE